MHVHRNANNFKKNRIEGNRFLIRKKPREKKKGEKKNTKRSQLQPSWMGKLSPETFDLSVLEHPLEFAFPITTGINERSVFRQIEQRLIRNAAIERKEDAEASKVMTLGFMTLGFMTRFVQYRTWVNEIVGRSDGRHCLG